MPTFLSRINSLESCGRLAGHKWLFKKVLKTKLFSPFPFDPPPPPAVPLCSPCKAQGTVEATSTGCLPLSLWDSSFLMNCGDSKQRPRVPIFYYLPLGVLFSLSLVLPWTWVVSCVFNADFQTPWHYLCGICLDLGECLSRWDKKGKLTRCCEETDLPLKVFLSSNSLHWRVC